MQALHSKSQAQPEHEGGHASKESEHSPDARYGATLGDQALARQPSCSRVGSPRRAQHSALQSAYGNQAVLRAMRAAGSGAAGVLRRECSSCGGSKAAGECPECEKKLERSPDGRAETGAEAPPVVHEALKSAGRPLDDQTRARMESRFGQRLGHFRPRRDDAPQAASAGLKIGAANDPHEHEAESAADAVTRAQTDGPEAASSRYDFGGVRVHTGAKAAESAKAVGALAYTVGRDIVFADGRYAPETAAGERLLAHELTHVLQQQEGGQSVSRLQRQADEEAPAETSEEEEGEEEGEEDEEEVHDGDSEVPGLDTTPDPPELPGEVFPEEPEEMEATESAEPVEQAGGGTKRRRRGSSSTRWITHIDVNLTTPQTMTLTFSSGPQTTHTVSTGKGRCGTTGDPCPTGNERFCTPKGTFKTNSRGNAKTKNSHGDPMAWFVGLNCPGRSGIGIHNSQIANGRPMSHGCVRTGDSTSSGAGDPGWELAKKINQMVKIGTTDCTVAGMAATVPYKCPKKKSASKKKKK